LSDSEFHIFGCVIDWFYKYISFSVEDDDGEDVGERRIGLGRCLCFYDRPIVAYRVRPSVCVCVTDLRSKKQQIDVWLRLDLSVSHYVGA